MTTQKRVALYSRYSTANQSDNYSIDIQHERMEAMCKSKGWEIAEYFSDPAYSGSNMERPSLQRLLDRLNEFDVVMVYRLDRLSRSQRDTMTLIQDHFLENNVAFVSVSETLDTTTPFGMAMIGILAVFAELERATITERMQSGIRKRIESGYRLLSGNYMPTGYKKGEDDSGNNILVIDEREATKVKRIFDLYEQCHSITKIQAILKDEGYENRRFFTIRNILSNRLYIGEVKYRDEYFEGVHEPIISKEQFDRVQILLSRHPKGKNAGKAKESLFSGMITCGYCGENYLTYSYKVENKKKGDYFVRSYLCSARRFPSHYEQKCMNNIWKNEKLESLFVKKLEQLIATKNIKEPKRTKQKNFSLAFKRLDEKIERLIDLYTDGEIDKHILDNKLEKLQKEKESLIVEERKVNQKAEDVMTFEDLKKSVFNFHTLDFTSKRAFVEKTLDTIIINGDNVDFIWNF